MRARPRAEEVDLVCNLYASSEANLARWCGGLHDSVNGGVYVPTPDGVKKCGMSSWIARDANGVFHVMTEAEVFARYEPLDSNEAYRVLGSRGWPTLEQLGA